MPSCHHVNMPLCYHVIMPPCRSSPFLQLGSLEYMAPERLLQAHVYDSKSDVYSLGLMLMELFVGRPLMPGGVADSMEMVREGGGVVGAQLRYCVYFRVAKCC